MDQGTYQILDTISKETNWSKGLVIRLLIRRCEKVFQKDIQNNRNIGTPGEEK